MGIIRQQTIKGSLISYAGAILGMVNTAILFPSFLLQEEIGLINWLIAVTIIASQFSTLGFNSVTSRLFPYFRDEQQEHHGFFFLVFCIGIVGSLLALVAFLILKPFAIEMYRLESPLYLKYLVLLLPLVFFSLFFNLLDAYNRVMYDAVSGTFYRELIFRLLVLVSIVLLSFKLIDFETFLFLYLAAYCLPAVLLFGLLWKRGHIHLKPDLKFIKTDLKRSMMSVSFYGILNGLSDKLTTNVDKIMIVSMTGLAANGVYATMLNFGSLVSMPARSLKKISSTVIAEAWKRKDMDTLRQIYDQSALHQFMLACLLFIGIWVNIDNIYEIVPKAYLEGQYVVFFIGLAQVVNMLGGVGGTLIQTSRYYKVQVYLMIGFGLCVVLTNALFIPVWGITGAAVASFLSLSLFKFSQFLFLKLKYQLQPYRRIYFLVIAVAFLSYGAGYALPVLPNFILDIVIRSTIVALIYIATTLLLRISPEMNVQAKALWQNRIKPLIP